MKHTKIEPVILKQTILKAKHPFKPNINVYKQASVFLLISIEEDPFNPFILAILKSDNKGYPWANQVALPGGHVDKNDSNAKEAAFRELYEELCIKKSNVDFISSIGHFQTINFRNIEVFTGLWNAKDDIQFDAKEIAKVFKLPLKNLIKIHENNNFSKRVPNIYELIYKHDDATIWGVTAKILHHFIEIVKPIFC